MFHWYRVISIWFRSITVTVIVARMKGDTPVNTTMSVGQARKLVEQLKIEASFCRIKASKTSSSFYLKTKEAELQLYYSLMFFANYKPHSLSNLKTIF